MAAVTSARVVLIGLASLVMSGWGEDTVPPATAGRMAWPTMTERCSPPKDGQHPRDDEARGRRSRGERGRSRGDSGASRRAHSPEPAAGRAGGVEVLSGAEEVAAAAVLQARADPAALQAAPG